MKRIFDIFLGTISLLLLALPMLITAIAVRLTSSGPSIYWSDRIGLDNIVFKMPKFRTMRTNTPAVATHLMNDAETFLTPIGGFLRRYSLDELPQLFSVLKGEMCFVGPRPALFNQDDLIELRTHSGVDKLKPGVTGWAQVNGRDELSIKEKVDLDVQYLNHQSFCFDLKILWMTFLKVIGRDDISH